MKLFTSNTAVKCRHWIKNSDTSQFKVCSPLLHKVSAFLQKAHTLIANVIRLVLNTQVCNRLCTMCLSNQRINKPSETQKRMPLAYFCFPSSELSSWYM